MYLNPKVNQLLQNHVTKRVNFNVIINAKLYKANVFSIKISFINYLKHFVIIII